MEIVEKSIILTFDELRILLYSLGERRCEGVYMPYKNFSAENVIAALEVMNRNGLLVLGRYGEKMESLPAIFTEADANELAEVEKEVKDEFFIRDDLLEMLGIIAEHNASEIINTETGRRLFCYYSEKGVLTSEKCSNRKDAVRLTQYTAEEFERFRKSVEEKSEWSLLL